MVDMNDLSSVKCPSCESDFLEEQKTFAEIRPVMEEASRQSQQSETSFEASFEDESDVFEQIFAPQQPEPAHNNIQLPEMRPQRHVTISTFIDENGQVTQTTSSSGNFSSNEAPMPPQESHRRSMPGFFNIFSFDDDMSDMMEMRRNGPQR